MPTMGDVAPSGPDWVARRFKELEDRIKRMETAKIGNAMTVDGPPGIMISGGGDLTISGGGDLTIDDGGNVLLIGGDLVASGGELRSSNYDSGNTGWRLRPGGNAEFNNITLRGGIIGNDALTSPITPAFGVDPAAGFALPQGTGDTGGGTTRASLSIPVPNGFTKALIQASAQAYGINDSGSPDYLNSYVDTGAGGSWSFASSSTAPNGDGAAAFAQVTDLLTGLSNGDHVTVRSRPFSYYDSWGTDPVNSTLLSALILFLR